MLFTWQSIGSFSDRRVQSLADIYGMATATMWIASGWPTTLELTGILVLEISPAAGGYQEGDMETVQLVLRQLAGALEVRRLLAERIAAERRLTIIPPYDDDRIIAGQGTVGLEIAEAMPDVAAVLVPIGGGGLASGVAVAVRALAPGARLIGVEPELAADAQQSLGEGRIVRWSPEDASRTIADGTRTTAIGRRNFAHLSRLLDDVVTVSESEIAAGVRLAAEESRLVVEPSGALTVAALAFRAREARVVGLDGPIVAVVSGGNVDPDQYRRYLEAPLPG